MMNEKKLRKNLETLAKHFRDVLATAVDPGDIENFNAIWDRFDWWLSCATPADFSDPELYSEFTEALCNLGDILQDIQQPKENK